MMKRILTFALSLPVMAWGNPAPQPAPADPVQATVAVAPQLPAAKLSASNPKVTLRGPWSSAQLIVTDEAASRPRDVTHAVTYEVEKPGVVSVDSHGFVTPVANGKTLVIASLPGTSGLPVPIEVAVEGFDQPEPIHFSNEVVSVFTKYGCNGGGCHGKSGGQNNFRLSLLGYEPWNDHEWLVRESRGRRVFPSAPEHSLLLTKATGEIPHEGGIRLQKGSRDYNTLVRWIREGMPYQNEKAPKVTGISVSPKERVANAKATQQLAVTAKFSDGSERDITRLALYESNQKDMAEVDAEGHVVLADRTGTASIMVRFQEHVDVFRATIPLGADTGTMPEKSNYIDEHIFKKLTLLGLPPSAPADDATFLRRVTVDIAGRLPTAEESRAFLGDASPDKRAKTIDRLLDSPDYAAYFAQKWAGILRNKRSKETYQRGTYAFHDWLRTGLLENRPYNDVVTDLLTASGEIGQNPEVAWFRAVKDQKEQMQDIAQVFLGIRMQCAQCHHHPYEKWSQDDYYSFAAFFSNVGRKPGEQPDEEIIFHKRGNATMQNPNTLNVLKPKPLGGDPLDLPVSEDPREALATWMTSAENPWFAKMVVNRYWKHFFSLGLVEPEDDMRVTNPASHPELLDALAADFAKSGFDLKHLVRTLVKSRTYQLSAVPNEHNLADTQNFSRYYPKRLQAEVLLDSINFVSKAGDTFKNQPAGVRAVFLPDDKFNEDSFFLSVFGRPEMDSACECERVADANLAQSLHLINSETIQGKLGGDAGRAAALAAAKDRPDPERLGELYLHALAREPRPAELEAAGAHLAKKRTAAGADPAALAKAEREAFEDILWALVNTKEFLFNH